MLRVTVYLKSGAVATFDAEAIRDATGEGAGHPRFRLDFVDPEGDARRLVYLDRDDVSAVVVENAGPGAATTPVATTAAMIAEALGTPAAADSGALTRSAPG